MAVLDTEGILRVRVARPPADGEANRAVIRLVARALGLAPSGVELMAGGRAWRKRLRIDGIDPEELERRLRALPSDGWSAWPTAILRPPRRAIGSVG